MKVFARVTFIILSVFIGLLLIFSTAYIYASLNAYNAILVTLILLIIFCIVALALMCGAIFHTYKTREAKGIFLVLTRLGLEIILPMAIFITKAHSPVKKSIRNFYIELNNIVVESDNKKYRPEDTMLLLPHCIQNSECGLKVTNDPYLCRNCGRCKIGKLIEFARQKRMNIYIVTGGTAARNIIKKLKPQLIISVACERDLMSGISDVRGIPVIGINNKQPNGPCFNTDVELGEIRNIIDKMTL